MKDQMASFRRTVCKSFSSYHSKILLSLLFCGLIPLVGTSFLLIHTIRSGKEQILDAVYQSDTQLTMEIDNRIGQIQSVIDSVQYSMYAISQTPADMQEKTEVSSVRNTLSLYQSTFNLLHIFAFLPSENMISNEGIYFLPLDELDRFGISSSTPTSSTFWFYQKHIPLPYVLNIDKKDYHSIGAGYILRDQVSKDIQYAFLVYMNPDELSSILSGSFSDDRIQSFIMTPAGQITASSVSASDGQMADSSIIASLQETSGSSVRVRMNSGTITRISPLSNGWFHVTTIRSSYVNENLKATLFSIGLILFLTVASILLVSAFLSQSLTSRVSLLSKAMRKYNPAVGLSEKTQTALGFRKPSGMLDEIDELSHTFLRMDDSIQSSLASIMELSLSGERLRYKLLLAQINPHFLYNILGTIQVCIHTGKPGIADQMIAELSQFYRLALRRSTEMIRIRDELEIARLYLELEKACHNGQLTWQFHLEDGIENYYICKFTLQPFLENCIHYGYSEADKCVSITLSAVYLDDKVQITIQDAGSGMSKEKLQQLRAVIESRSVDYSKNFGIGSVSWRISSPSYGNGTLKIDSAPGEGTIVTITIDQIEEYSE